MKCPNCRLENPPSAQYCDCGYRFATGEVDSTVALRKAPSDWVLQPNIEKVRRDALLICPHCQTKGTVTTKPTVRKVGISGGKAVGAIMTLGWSMLATGLSRKEHLTEAHCSNCGSVWHF